MPSEPTKPRIVYVDDDLELTTLVQGWLGDEGFEVVVCALKKSGKGHKLEIVIDVLGRETYAPPERGADGELSGESVTVDDCAKVSRALGPELDVADLVPNAYRLEVSSPGVNRPLVTPSHFQRAVGLRVRVKTRVPVAGETFRIAPLVSADDDELVLEGPDGPVAIPYRHVARANVEYEFPFGS